jgi:Putative adhesin
MMAPQGRRYNGAVRISRWRGAAGLLLASVCWLTLAAQARADEQMDVGQTPILQVQLGTGVVNIQTWDRQQVQVSADGSVNVQHIDAAAVDPTIGKQIPNAAHSVETIHGTVTLPPEPFMLPKLAGTQHDEVRVVGDGNTTITVPNTSAMVIAHVEHGRVYLNNYRGVFITQVHEGRVTLSHVEGSGYVESLRGAVVATDSTFDRLRVRTATSNVIFNRCTSRQIEASSTYGSIVYNNGSFQPGLARFESEHGNVAVGVRGGAQLGGHSDVGRVASSFPTGTDLRENGNTTQATIEGGGPVVTATSKDGSVYLYNGALAEHPDFRAAMQTGRLAPFHGAPVPDRAFSASGRQFVPPPRTSAAPPKEFAPAEPRRFAPRAPEPHAYAPRQYAPRPYVTHPAPAHAMPPHPPANPPKKH